VATGNLTFFRQVGASVGLALVGTIFADSFVNRLRPELVTAGVPDAIAGAVEQFSSNGGGDITQVSDVPLEQQLAQVPAFAGIVDEVVTGIHQAFSLAIADTFWVALVASLLALGVIVVGLRDLPFRSPADRAATESVQDGEPQVTPPAMA
jgi:hypothetical protein